MSRTATNMERLIKNKYYATAENALYRLDLYIMIVPPRLTDDEYTTLCALVEEYYPDVEALAESENK